ncbi:protein FAM214A-like [Huso huso]|uniref:Atos homolog protein A n=1 Tax=Huso huso TaxID=61971 RepID=A0ABR0YRF5_HUSHU
MKPDRDASEEYFEYDTEDLLVFLTLLITEGRTPECSVKGRTEGLHCPPAQSGQPVNTKHECSDKLPQCRQARRTRSEVVLLWRNNIPIMVEVMLLPDCCYSDEGSTSEGNDINDPAIKQDALLLERWTLQPVPRQSGDRFIEEKTLLLAVRSYVFFSQLSAWLSASHGVVPRNILYRISAAEEELIWNFTQPPTEHIFPVPNVSHSVALKVRVQSLPRQPNYPVLKCSIHTSLTVYGKKIQEQEENSKHCDITEVNQCSLQGSPQLFSKPTWSPLPDSVVNPRKCSPPEASSPGKAVRWYYSKLNNGSDVRSRQPKNQDYSSTSRGESSKMQPSETQIQSFKSLSLADSHVPASQCTRLSARETNPLIGSLLQERQEVIARIAQHLNYCDPTAPHIPGSLFSNREPNLLGSNSFWSSHEEDSLFKNSKDPSSTNCTPQDGAFPENSCEGKSRSSSSDTPVSLCSKAKIDSELRSSPMPGARRRLLLPDSSEGSRISKTVQDISRLVQDTIQQSQNKCNGLLNSTYEICKEGMVKEPNKTDRLCSSSKGQKEDLVPCQDTSRLLINTNSTDVHICTNIKSSRTNVPDNNKPDCSLNLQYEACKKLEDTRPKSELQMSDSLHNAKKGPDNILYKDCFERTKEVYEQNKFQLTETSSHKEINNLKGRDQAEKCTSLQDENKDPSTFTIPILRGSHEDLKGKAERAQDLNVLNVSAPSPLKPCNVWKKQNRRSLDGIAAKAFHPCTRLPLLSSPVPQRRTQTGYFDLATSLSHCKGLPWSSTKRVSLKTEDDEEEQGQQLLSTSAPPASLSLLGNFEASKLNRIHISCLQESVLNHRLEPLGTIEGFTTEVGASGTFCPSHMTLPVEVSFYSVSDDNAPSPYKGVINLESLGKRGYRVPPSGTIQVTLFNPSKTVVKMFVVIYDLREMPANHQTFLRQRTYSIPMKRDMNGNVNKKNLLQTEERILRYLIHLRFQSSKSGKIYLHRDIRLLFSRKSMEVDSGAAYELKSYTEAPANPPFSQRC